jgi:hypothetical protein
MNHMKKYSLTATFAFPLALAVALTVSSGCSKQEKTETDHSNMKMSDASAESTPATGATMEPKAMAEPAKAGELAPLSPEIVQTLTSNRSATVYEQVYAITNTINLSDTEKAQSLMKILPSFDLDGQRAVAHAAVKYADESTYALIREPLLEGKLDPQILSVFMTDALQRSDSIKIPILTSLAHMKEHPMQNEAQELLTSLSKPHSAASGSTGTAFQRQTAI